MATIEPTHGSPIRRPLPIEVIPGILLGGLVGSVVAILGDVDADPVVLATGGSAVFGALGLVNWLGRANQSPLSSDPSFPHEQ